jgi:hypothetical protein
MKTELVQKSNQIVQKINDSVQNQLNRSVCTPWRADWTDMCEDHCVFLDSRTENLNKSTHAKDE